MNSEEKLTIVLIIAITILILLLCGFILWKWIQYLNVKMEKWGNSTGRWLRKKTDDYRGKKIKKDEKNNRKHKK